MLLKYGRGSRSGRLGVVHLRQRTRHAEHQGYHKDNKTHTYLTSTGLRANVIFSPSAIEHTVKAGIVMVGGTLSCWFTILFASWAMPCPMSPAADCTGF